MLQVMKIFFKDLERKNHNFSNKCTFDYDKRRFMKKKTTDKKLKICLIGQWRGEAEEEEGGGASEEDGGEGKAAEAEVQGEGGGKDKQFPPGRKSENL